MYIVHDNEVTPSGLNTLVIRRRINAEAEWVYYYLSTEVWRIWETERYDNMGGWWCDVILGRCSNGRLDLIYVYSSSTLCNILVMIHDNDPMQIPNTKQIWGRDVYLDPLSKWEKITKWLRRDCIYWFSDEESIQRANACTTILWQKFGEYGILNSIRIWEVDDASSSCVAFQLLNKVENVKFFWMQLQQKTIYRSSRIEITSLQLTLEKIEMTHLLHKFLTSVYVVHDNEVLTSLLRESKQRPNKC